MTSLPEAEMHGFHSRILTLRKALHARRRSSGIPFEIQMLGSEGVWSG